MFCKKKPVLESLCNKVTGLQACNFVKKRPHRRYFSAKFAKFIRRPILKNIFERLLLILTVRPCQTSLLEICRSSHPECPIKKVFLKICKIHRKTLEPDSLALIKNFIKKETLAQVFF